MAHIPNYDPNEETPTGLKRPYRGPSFSSVFNAIGGLTGILAIALVIFRGGALENQVKRNTDDIIQIFRDGSPNFRTHEKADDERVNDLRRRSNEMDARMLALENSMKQYGELKVEIRVIGTKLDGIAERLKGIEEKASERFNRLNEK